MLGLKLPTDPRWVKLVEGNISEILTDHAWCEQKAASNAISTIVRFPELTDLVEELTRIAQEEMEHFGMVVEKIKARGWTLGYERKDDYVGQLSKIIKRGGSREEQLVDRLLFAAMIEARSCERFKMLSERIEDPDLASFYRELMISEAGPLHDLPQVRQEVRERHRRGREVAKLPRQGSRDHAGLQRQGDDARLTPGSPNVTLAPTYTIRPKIGPYTKLASMLFSKSWDA